jgi:hypothetical protein
MEVAHLIDSGMDIHEQKADTESEFEKKLKK